MLEPRKSHGLGKGCDCCILGVRGQGLRPFPQHLGGIHEAVCRPERAEARVLRIVDDQQEMHMVRHDHEIGDCGTGEDTVQRQQQPLYGFATRKQRRTGALVDKARKHTPRGFGGAPVPFQRDCHKEKLSAGMMELHFHTGTILPKTVRQDKTAFPHFCTCLRKRERSSSVLVCGLGDNHGRSRTGFADACPNVFSKD